MFSANRRRPSYQLDLDVPRRSSLSRALMYSPMRRLSSLSSDDFIDNNPCAAMGAWFLGPNGENGDIFQDLLTRAVESHVKFRQSYFPCDPPYVTNELRSQGSFKKALKNLKTELDNLQRDLGNSVPFFSSRYKGHVNWDTNMPANLGYISAMLFNQNNCCAESSTVTTKFEVEVGKDLCEMMGYEEDKCLGHLASGGSLANIEAIWAARNVKYFPLGLKEALLKEDRLANARGYKVLIPQRGKEVEITSASQWELLNLDVDTVLKMPFEVEAVTKLEHQEFIEIMGSYLYESIGAQEFARRHELKNTACVLVPRTSHVSFAKAVTILGLGRESLIAVAKDKDARMDPKDLKRILTEKMQQEIPVVTVAVVMGTTEESAVDPLTDVLDLRDEFRKKGLNFSIHADGAWGGYFCSMLRDPPKSSVSQATELEGFVPEMYLSTYVQEQLSALHHCDTITIDPHKSGFCPYPAGAICYRDKTMNSFLRINAGVAYYHGKFTLGDVGLEGSKPGAAAAGVMLANRVIGLHKNGYGRILAECMFTSKIVYCLWLTLAREDDNFVVHTTKPLPKFKNWSEQEQIRFIKERILGRSNKQLVQDEEAMEYLKEIGPDTLMPCFSVNLKDNKSVELCNAINTALFQSLRHTSDEHSAHHIPMIVTASSMIPYKHSAAVADFKERLGLEPNGDTPVKFIITTCMDPWATSIEFLDNMAVIMRNTILCAIGTVIDPIAVHTFVSTGVVNHKAEVIACYVGDFNNSPKQYDTVVKLRFESEDDANQYLSKQKELLQCSKQPPPIVFRSKKKRLHDVFFEESDYAGERETFHCFVGLPASDDDNHHPFLKAKMRIIDVPRYEHFDEDEYPEYSSYFMYGDQTNTFLFHIPTKNPDFFQIVQLDGIPEGFGNEVADDLLLRYGIEIEIPNIPGKPVIVNGEVQDPLLGDAFDISFVGIDGQEELSEVKIARKIWFAATDNVYGSVRKNER
ncbi:uncharacterized protein [Montipora foliosa]|uniref:uncharacterized protein isoform X1 n=1 Tax=Montipora foliosa TaxID=591990 RepID=UPI0035F14BE3